MKIVIAGGRSRADFLIDSLKAKKHTIIAINDDLSYSEYLASRHNIPVVFGDATKRYVLDDADIEGFDVLIALTSSDADNLVVCQTAKRFYGVKKNVCCVTDPQNVEVFKRLGISTVISATFMVAQLIEEASTVQGLIDNIENAGDEPYLGSMLSAASGAGAQADDPSMGIPRIVVPGKGR